MQFFCQIFLGKKKIKKSGRRNFNLPNFGYIFLKLLLEEISKFNRVFIFILYFVKKGKRSVRGIISIYYINLYLHFKLLLYDLLKFFPKRSLNLSLHDVIVAQRWLMVQV